tara:strand:+ start:5486 stop:5998 length:513 start_codon:yes stop_codon:yes gene_type:complete
MAIPQNKSELLSAVKGNYRQLAREFASIPAERSREATLDGHARDSQISVHDLAAYLLGWGRLVLKWQERRAADLPVDFPETGYKWNELGPLAQKFYRDHAGLDYVDLLQQLDQNQADMVALIDGLSDAELYGQAWYERWTLGRMIQFNTAAPYANARSRLRRWKKQQGLV